MSSTSSDFDDFSVISDVDDPISKLESQIGFMVGYFGDGHQMIQMSMKQDQINKDNFDRMEQDLREQGDHSTANRLVKASRQALNHSLEKVMPMRQHIEEIAQLLDEIVDPEVQTEVRSLKAIVLAVHDESKAATAIAVAGKEKFQALTEQLQDIEGHYHAISEKAKKEGSESEQNVGKHQKEADWKAWQRDVSGCLAVGSSCIVTVNAGVGAAGAGFGAPYLATTPLTAFLTTQVTTAAAAATAAPFVFNPVAVGVGIGFTALFAVVAVSTGLAAADASGQCKQALQSKETAEKEATEKQDVARKAEGTKTAANQMVVKAKAHESMWDGLSTAAELAADRFSRLKKIDPSGARRRRFNELMKKYAQDLLYFVQAIDEYLFFLHKQDFFPSTFRIEQAMGRQRFLKLEEDWEAAAARVAEGLQKVTSNGAKEITERACEVAEATHEEEQATETAHGEREVTETIHEQEQVMETSREKEEATESP